MYSTTELSYSQLQRLSQAVDAYYSSLSYNPTEEDLSFWLNSLHEDIRGRFVALGLSVCKQMPAFRHFYAELHSLECKPKLADYMAKHLSTEDYQAWLSLGD